MKKPSTKDLVETYRKLLEAGRVAEAKALIDAHRDNAFLLSLGRFGDALVSVIVEVVSRPLDHDRPTQ